MPEIKPVKLFSRENPCTKVDLHNAFVGPDGKYRAVPVVEARGEIGLNSPKYLIKKRLMTEHTRNNVDYYQLTREGELWLQTGLTSHLERHPDDRKKVKRSRS